MAWVNDLASLGQPKTTEFLQNPSDRFPLLSQLGGIYEPKQPEQSLAAYKPTLRDGLASMFLGDNPSNPKRDFVQGLLGSLGAGNSGMSLADLTPLGSLFGAQEAARQGDYQGAALAAVPIPGSRMATPVKESVKEMAERLAASLKEAGFKTGNTQIGDVTHWGSGSSYLGQPSYTNSFGETFRYPREIRISDHSTGPARGAQEKQIYDGDGLEQALSEILEVKQRADQAAAANHAVVEKVKADPVLMSQISQYPNARDRIASTLRKAGYEVAPKGGFVTQNFVERLFGY